MENGISRFGANIKKRRLELGLTQVELARKIWPDACAYNPSNGAANKTLEQKRKNIVNYEGGTFPKDGEVYYDLCTALECDMDYLFGRIDMPTHKKTDIHDATGLSEPAIRHLAGIKHFASHERTIKYNSNTGNYDISESPSANIESSVFTKWLDTVSILLSEKAEGKSSTVLDLINEYLSFEFSGRRTITVCGSDCKDYVFDRERMVDLLLFEVMTALVKLREKSGMNAENCLPCEAEGVPDNGSD